MAATINAQDALAALRAPTDLAILRLTDPAYTTRQLSNDKGNDRLSNASSTVSNPNHDPSILRADLQHYRELFSKLRFSYVEQVTKEKFLRAVTAETPEFVSHELNARLDEENRENKRMLAEKKEELRGMLSDLEAQSHELARRYQEIGMQTNQLETLPVEIEELEAKISSLRAEAQPQSDDPDLRLPLNESLSLLAQKERESAALDAQIANMRNMLPQKDANIQALEDDLRPLDTRRQTAMAVLAEAESKRRTGGDNDAELQLRWLRGVEASMRVMLAT